MKTNPLVSVIITTKNEEKNLLNCIKSIRLQTYPNIEIIVVDNYSTDKTIQIAKECSDKFFLAGTERSRQRNYGVKKSSGEYILYLDADMIIEKNLIEECINQIIQEVVALHIQEKILGESYYSRVRNFERSFYSGTVIDGARFFIKKKFIEAGGFDEELCGPEDWAIDLQIREKGGMISLLKNSWINHNESEFNLKKYLNKKSYYSKSFDKYKEKWGSNYLDIKKQLGFYYRFVGVFIENGKWKKLIKHPLLTIGMYYLRFRVGLRYIKRSKL